ncbi:hypothetical protein O6H91_21G073400 [Diphasiastrum complanatum]|uniref:Uncharacterized protein n=2 Tax=Diphasiastrum complanatum TaxID=34168 RepID=A0ACC2ALU1_DIPCM|nr:hypothetical protein O6H91_21G073400 [Diphasiastrum complanatum]KAJ7518542.1 hypothetical protein O6H91_21G073400 [Diphasiastrum complanatum]
MVLRSSARAGDGDVEASCIDDSDDAKVVVWNLQDRLSMALPVSRLSSIVAAFVHVHPHELASLLYAFAAFFFLLSAYFMVLPLRDEAALSLGAKTLPTLFLGSLVLTMLAAPVSSMILSSNNLLKGKGIVLLYRLFGGSLVLFLLLYNVVPANQSSKRFQALKEELTIGANQDHSLSEDMKLDPSFGEGNFTYSFVAVRASFFVWVALLNLFTISALWTRLTDVMSSEAASRLFGFIGAGATLGQLAGSLFAVALAKLGPLLLLLSALSMELAAQCASYVREEDDTACFADRSSESNQQLEVMENKKPSASLVQGAITHVGGKLAIWFKGFELIIASKYLLLICAFSWLTALMSSFFYLERASVVAGAVADPIGRRILLAKINSLTAVFILFGQLTFTGHFLSKFGVTAAICASPMIGMLNILMIATSPTSFVIAVSEAFRKFINYVITRPGKEILFTVLTREEKYTAKVYIDTFIQRLGDAVAAGLFKVISSVLFEKPSATPLLFFPVCFTWLLVAFFLGRRQAAFLTNRMVFTPTFYFS